MDKKIKSITKPILTASTVAAIIHSPAFGSNLDQALETALDLHEKAIEINNELDFLPSGIGDETKRLVDDNRVFAENIYKDHKNLKQFEEPSYQSTNLYSHKTFKKVKHKNSDAARRLVYWKKFVDANQNKSDDEKVKVVNDYVNGLVKYKDDKQNWKDEDYWATPVETLSKRRGDCEDFVILKYRTLIELGVPDSKLLASYVKTKKKQAHMVLLYKDEKNKTWVLDNINKSIQTKEQRNDLTHRYQFNKTSAFVTGVKINPDRIMKWSQVKMKMASEELTSVYNNDLILEN